MVGKKVNLAWITDEATRRMAFKKRRKGVIKKASEISTLCDVEACVVVYEPHKVQPEVWPSDESKVKDTLIRFKSMPETEQNKKRVDQVGFLRQQISKVEEQIRKQYRDNLELQMKISINEAVEGKCSPRVVGIQETAVLERLMEETLETVKAAKRKKKLTMDTGKTTINPSDDEQQKQLEGGISFGGGVGGLEDEILMGSSCPIHEHWAFIMDGSIL